MPDILYGRQVVKELLRSGRRNVRLIRVARNIHESEEILEIRQRAAKLGIRLLESGRRELDRLTGTQHHQGVMAEAASYPYAEFAEIMRGLRAPAGEPPLLLLLDHIQDPQNLGSVLRTAEAVGVRAVLIPKDRSAHITPAVVKASAGATEHLNISLVVNLVQAMRRLKDLGISLVGLHPVPEAKCYTNQDLTGPLAIVVGSEGQGLGRLVRENCDQLLQIPMTGQVGSLNAAVAASLLLYEATRQRLAPASQTRPPDRTKQEPDTSSMRKPYASF